LNSRTNANLLEEKREARLEHMRGFFSEIDYAGGFVSAIRNRTGDTAACILALASFAIRNALLSWFDKNDIRTTKNWWHTSATLTKNHYEMKPLKGHNVGAKFLSLMPPLLSDDDDLIAWYANADAIFDLDRVEDHKTHDFWSYQAIVALRGDWPRLQERCETVLADPPGASKEQKYLIDHRFYLALARGDEQAMNDVIRQLITPKLLSARRNYESGFTGDLISTPAVILCKLAWRAGFHIDTQSPFVPLQWLPVNPLPEYEEYFHLPQ
jgi:hypothetical protein